MKHLLLNSLILFSCSFFCNANNLQIGSVTVSTSNGNQYLNFTVSWENSWRTSSSSPYNYDAVWLFVKRKECAGNQWTHVNLSDLETDHSAGVPLLVDAYQDKKGVMLYRSSDGAGNITSVNIQLKLHAPPVGNFQYKAIGIEMVYIPQGSFYVGDGYSVNSLQKWPTLQPFLITNENPIPIGQDSGKLFYINVVNAGTSGIVSGTTLSAAYPKGYNAFYCMKYEVSQGQYAEFLNLISADAASNRFLSGNVGIDRYNIQGVWPQYYSTTPNVACNLMSFQDLAAILDWSALSPMSELEYEKVCRGANNPAVAGELAWGSITATDADTIATGTAGTPIEYVTDIIIPGSGLASFFDGISNVNFPLRCGFAARTGTDRFQSGATYYGVLEMSGNVMERCYNLLIDNTNNTGGGFFVGGHGDGELTSTPNAGYANVGWPKEEYEFSYSDGNAVADKGGSYIRMIGRLAVSDRFFATNNDGNGSQRRMQDYGGRGVSRRQ
jgi:formylglycine-generating enzyme required for sulfatase activity